MSHYLDVALQAVADLKCADCHYFFPHESGDFNLGRCRHPDAESIVNGIKEFAAVMREPTASCGLSGSLWSPDPERIPL